MDSPLSSPPRATYRDVLSPSTRTLDLTEKRDLYAAQGVPHLWFVDPLARTLEAFALNDGSWTLLTALSDDAEVKVAPFDAVGFPLDVLWVDRSRSSLRGGPGQGAWGASIHP